MRVPGWVWAAFLLLFLVPFVNSVYQVGWETTWKNAADAIDHITQLGPSQMTPGQVLLAVDAAAFATLALGGIGLLTVLLWPRGPRADSLSKQRLWGDAAPPETPRGTPMTETGTVTETATITESPFLITPLKPVADEHGVMDVKLWVQNNGPHALDGCRGKLLRFAALPGSSLGSSSPQQQLYLRWPSGAPNGRLDPGKGAVLSLAVPSQLIPNRALGGIKERPYFQIITQQGLWYQFRPGEYVAEVEVRAEDTEVPRGVTTVYVHYRGAGKFTVREATAIKASWLERHMMMLSQAIAQQHLRE